MSAHPTPPSPDRLTVDADLLTAGYGRVLELEAHRTALVHEIDALLAEGHEQHALRLVRLQRELSHRIAAERDALGRLSARQQPRRRPAAAGPPPGP